MKKQSLVLLLLLSACQKDDDQIEGPSLFDRIKIFFGISKPETSIETERPEGETRVIAPIKSDVSDGNWHGDAMGLTGSPSEEAASDQGTDQSESNIPNVVPGPGVIPSENKPESAVKSLPQGEDNIPPALANDNPLPEDQPNIDSSQVGTITAPETPNPEMPAMPLDEGNPQPQPEAPIEQPDMENSAPPPNDMPQNNNDALNQG